MRSRRSWAIVLGVALLTGCSPGSSSNTSSPRTSREPASHRSTPTAGTPTLQVGRVTVYVCRTCIQAARDRGTNLARTIEHSIRRIDQLLSLPTAYVDVTDDPKATIPGIGVGGESLGARVPLALDPGFRRFEWTVRVRVPMILAHELAETKRSLDGPGGSTSLLDWLVTDGIADHFALQAFPGSPRNPWDHALSRSQERDLWRLARRHLDDFIRFATWFFGSKAIPRWTGYTLGFDLVGSYLSRHPGATPADLVLIDARTILRGSGFSP